MYCTSCGTQLNDTANFCAECGHATGRTSPPPQAPRRLYRLPHDKMIAGVCAGIAHYLDVDVTLVRIAAVAALFCSAGLMILGYIAAIFIMPVDRGLPVRSSTEARATS
jgi:phage shock protein C